MSFAWTPALSVGVATIDRQHQELFQRVNALLVAVGGQREDNEVLSTLGFLGEYIVTHFEDEERVMQERAYPGFAFHLGEHRRLVGTFERLRQKFARHGVDRLLTEEVEAELCDWLVQHVQGTDRALGQWLSQREPSPPQP